MKKSRIRLAFIMTWGIFMLFAQIPVLLIASAVGYERNSVIVIELLTAILTSMAAALAVAKEEIVDGKEIFRKE